MRDEFFEAMDRVDRERRDRDASEKSEQEETEKLLRQWFYDGQEVILPGTEGKAHIVGFGKKFIPYGDRDHKRAGVYFDFDVVHLVKTNGESEVRKTGTLACISWDHMSSGQDELHKKMRALNVRISDLPDTPFWMGDKVSRHGYPKDDSRVITQIYYEMPGPEMKNSLVYRFADASGSHTEPEENLSLVERGNPWKLEHREPLSFPGTLDILGTVELKQLYEEGLFYKSLGMSHKVPFRTMECDPGGTEYEFLWPWGPAICALQEGRANRLIPKNKGAQGVILIKYDSEEFGERMRAAELKRLGFEPDDPESTLAMGEA